MVRATLLATAAGVAACGYTEPSVGPPDMPPDAHAGGAPDGPMPMPDGMPCTDKDGDGICDSVDAWLCGATAPSRPGNTISLESQNSNVQSVDFGTSDPRVLMATPGQQLRFSYNWGLQVDCPGSTCEAQIEYGIAGISRIGCLVDINVDDNAFAFSLDWHANVIAPTAPAVYEVRAKVALKSSCGTGSTWYGGTEPDSSETIAYICVPP